MLEFRDFCAVSPYTEIENAMIDTFNITLEHNSLTFTVTDVSSELTYFTDFDLPETRRSLLTEDSNI